MEKKFRYISENRKGFVILCIIVFALNPDISGWAKTDTVFFLYWICFTVIVILTFWSWNISGRCAADDEKIKFWLWLGRKKIFYYQDIQSVDCTYEYYCFKNSEGYHICLIIETREQSKFSLMQNLPYEPGFITNPEYFTEKLEATEFMQIKNFLESEISS